MTSAGRRLAESWLRHLALPIPSVLITADDVLHGKPDPQCYILAAEKLDCDPVDLVVFEDASSGLAAAMSAGSRVIAVGNTLASKEIDQFEWIQDFSSVRFVDDENGMLQF